MIPAGTRIYFATQPTDLRRSFDGLAATVMSVLQKDPRLGGLFVFINRRQDQVRILFRDAHGWCILAKRLDRGRFSMPKIKDGVVCWEADMRTMMAFLDDVQLRACSSKSRTKNKAQPHLAIVEKESKS